MSRISWIVLTTAVSLSCLLGAPPVRADIDASGRWLIHTYTEFGDGFGVEDWQQTGSSLESGSGDCMWTGTIDVSSGNFSQSHPPLWSPPGICTSVYGTCANMGKVSTRSGTVDMTTRTFSGSGTTCVSMPVQCFCAPFGQVGTLCGGGAIDPGEACDDGNGADGDGCSASCEVEPCFTCAGNPSVCTPVSCDDGHACTEDVCNPGSGICEHHVPTQACRAAAKSTLSVRGDDHRIAWKWRRGDATDLAELDDPTSTAGYTLCLDDGDKSIVEASIPPGQGWSALAHGYKFDDAAGANNGVEKIVVKAGTDGRAAITLKTVGTTLPGGVPPLPLPARMRLANDATGICWAATYDAPGVIRNDAGTFKARRR